MTVQSATTVIDTNGSFESVETLTGITFTQGNVYTMQIQNTGYIKEGDAIFELRDKFLQWTADGETLYIKTQYLPCTLTILEHPAA